MSSIHAETEGMSQFDAFAGLIAKLKDRGAQFVPTHHDEDYVQRLADELRAGPGLVYGYGADLDTAAHVFGIGSPRWHEAAAAVDARLTRVSGHAERLAALDMVQHVADRPRAVTLGADRGYDAADFVEELRTMNVRPHVAQNVSGRRSAIDKRTTRHPGYADSQRIRKRIEEAFGWIKAVAGLRQTKFRGLAKVDWAFTFATAAYNLMRVPKLIEAAT